MLRKHELAAGGEPGPRECEFALAWIQQTRTPVEECEAALRMREGPVPAREPIRFTSSRRACCGAWFGDGVTVAEELLVNLDNIGRSFRPWDLAKARHQYLLGFALRHRRPAPEAMLGAGFRGFAGLRPR